MIVIRHTKWLRILLMSGRGTALVNIWRRVAVIVLLATIVTALHVNGWFSASLTPLPFTLMGLALSIFLGFRNNTSYDRFWEGRKLWGALVNTSRSTTRQILTLIDASGDDGAALRRELVYRQVAYAHSLRHHLRDEADAVEELEEFLPKAEVAALAHQRNRPVAILQRQGQRFAELWRAGKIHDMHLPVLEHSLTEFTTIQGGCERIKNTPIPFSYTVLIHRLVAVYCLALPFGITEAVGLYTPLVVLMVSYAFLGLDAIGDEIEEPFGRQINDLPLTSLSRNIEINLRQSLGETDLPSPHLPIDGVLH